MHTTLPRPRPRPRPPAAPNVPNEASRLTLVVAELEVLAAPPCRLRLSAGSAASLGDPRAMRVVKLDEHAQHSLPEVSGELVDR